MKSPVLRFKLVFLLFFISFVGKAQHFVHDFGIHAGAATIRTDYGQRDDVLGTIANVSPSFSFTHTLHFFNRNSRWNNNHKLWSYLALRTELNFIPNAEFQHFGALAERNDAGGELLRAMTGKANIVNLGFQFEYYLHCLRDFIHPLSDLKFNPYILAGLQFTSFDNEINSTLGDWTQNPNVLPAKWRPSDATNVGPGTTFAATFGGGIRYNLTRKIDLNAQANWQFFFSDAVDGLTANVDENLNNEWLLSFQVGVIFHLNFDRPLLLF